MKKIEIENVIYVFLGFLLMSLFSLAIRLPNNTGGTIFGMNYNLLAYLVIISFTSLLFFAITVAYSSGRKKNDTLIKKEQSGYGKPSYIGAVLVAVVGILYLYQLYDNENSIYPHCGTSFLRNESILHVPYFFAFCILFVFFIFLAMRITARYKGLRASAMFFMALLCSLLVFAPNPYLDASGRLYHTHAYTNSIVNVAMLNPFNDFNISIYGHYGLVMLPFVKLLGNNYTAIAIVISACAFVAYFCAFYVCNVWIENDAVYMASLFSITGLITLLYISGQYYQVNPHRLLFPSISLFVLTRFLKGEFSPGKKLIIGTIVGTLAVIWNVETGLFCLIVFSMFSVVSKYRDNLGVKNVLSATIKAIICSLICVLLAYLIVNFYNFLCGSRSLLSIKRFIYPFGSDTVSISSWRLPLPTTFSIYILQIIIYSFAILSTILHKIDGALAKEIRDKDIIQFSIAVSGLLSITYFMNRAAYSNISISWIQMVIILALFGDRGIHNIRKYLSNKKSNSVSLIRTSGQLVLLFVLFSLALESSLYVQKSIEFRVKSSWDTSSFVTFMNEVKENVPENTFAFGAGIPELYYQLGWRTGLVVTDWPDMNELNNNRVRNELKSQQYFFARIDEQTLGKYQIVDNRYDLIQRFQIGANQYGLYEIPEQ